MDEIPQWAKKRAVELCNDEYEPGLAAPYTIQDTDGWQSIRALARYIVEHEAPPLDPAVQALVDALRRELPISLAGWRDEILRIAAVNIIHQLGEAGFKVVEPCP